MLGTLAESQQKICCALAILCLSTLVSTGWGQEDREGPPTVVNPAAQQAAATKTAKEEEGTDDTPPRPAGEPVAIEPITALVGAHVRTLSSNGTIEAGVVLVQGGKITAVGDAQTTIPERATRIDLTGYVLTPGLIDTDSRLWLSSDSQSASASDASLDVVDGLDPYREDWHEVIRHGVTSVYVQPASSGVMSGFGAVVSVAPQAGQPVIHKQLVSLQASFGSSASSNRVRAQQYARIKKLLEDAAAYAKKWKEYNDYQAKQEAKKNAQQKGNDQDKAATSKDAGKPASEKPASEKTEPRKDPAGGVAKSEDSKSEDSKSEGSKSGDKESPTSSEKKSSEDAKPPKKPDVDPILERLVKVLEGEIPIRFEVNTSDEVTFLNKLLDEEGFAKVQVILSGLADLRSSLDSVLASNRPVVLGPWLELERSDSRRMVPVQATWGTGFDDYAGALSIASAGRSPRSSRLLRANAAVAVAHGLDADRALRGVTVEAARILGLEDLLGTIAVGKRADLVAFKGEPLDPTSPVKLVMIGGETTYENPEVLAGDVTDAVSEMALPTLPERFPSAYRLRSTRVLVDGRLQPAAVVIEDGRIVSVETDLAGADGQTLREIDCGDAVITPGLFSAHAQLGLGRYVDPRGLPDASFVVAADCLVNDQVERQALVESGLLRVALAPGNANPIAGSMSIVRLAGEEPVVQREAGLKLVLTSSARSADAFPSSLGGQVQLLRQSLAGQLLDSRLYVPTLIDEALNVRRATALQAAMGENARLTVIAAGTDAEIRAALDVIEQHQLKAALLGPRQLLPFIDRLRALDVSLIVQGNEPETFQWFYDDLSAAAKAGVDIAFAGENAEQLRLIAAMSGLSADVALNALFVAPKSWGVEVEGLAGSQPADLVIWSDSPLDLSAKPLRVVVDGHVVDVD